MPETKSPAKPSFPRICLRVEPEVESNLGDSGDRNLVNGRRGILPLSDRLLGCLYQNSISTYRAHLTNRSVRIDREL